MAEGTGQDGDGRTDTDGFAPYISAIGASFGPGVDYAQTIKNYTRKGRREGGSDHRYEPPRDPFITKKSIFGAPKLDTASTAYVERNNGTMRHHIGRMRRLCLAFSKKLPNHRAAIALAYVHYNLCHVVSTLRVTPAMAAHVTDHVWELRELLAALLDAAPCEAPTKQALASRVPEVTHRELPAGRGFLRVVDGGKSVRKDVPKMPTPPMTHVASPVVESPVVAQEPAKVTPVPVAKPATASMATTAIPVKLVPRRWEQMDLFSGNRAETRTFADDSEDCPY